MNDDAELLRRYAVDGSEEAFAELVRRYVNMVYFAALRQVGVDAHLAEDITQSVFVDLARKAKKLARHTSIAGWLYTSVRFAAATARRARERREQREQESSSIANAAVLDQDAQWDRIAPVLDEAMHALREKDRHAILLRFFQGKTFGQVGYSMGLDENAARKRVERALEKLRSFLERRGITVPAGMLGGVLAAEGASAAPVSLAAIITKASLIGATQAAPGIPLAILKIMSISTPKIIGTAITIGLTGVIIHQAQSNSALREQNNALSRRVLALQPPATNSVSHTQARPITDEQLQELWRLRGQVTVLKRQLADAAAARTNAVASVPEASPQAEERADEQQGIVKMGQAKVWMGALFRYARNNNDTFPQEFADAADLLPTALQSAVNPGEPVPDIAEFHEATNRFEIVYHGSLKELTNWASTIVLREKEPWQSPDGGWLRTYGFADGHSEIHKAVDGNFEQWERQRWANQ